MQSVEQMLKWRQRCAHWFVSYINQEALCTEDSSYILFWFMNKMFPDVDLLSQKTPLLSHHLHALELKDT